MNPLLFCFTAALAAIVWGCADDDFATSSACRLEFSTDTLQMDTVFARTAGPTHTLWVRNPNKKGVRISQVRLARGNQSGFRANVDGIYLDNTAGSTASGLELRGGDSLRVFAEITPHAVGSKEPATVEDRLVFTLDGGQTQEVVLQASAWDATLISSLRVSRDTTLTADSPLVIADSIRVDSAATLTIKGPATLFFGANAGIEVYGRLVVEGGPTPETEVVMRGSRTDRLFPYLPYDRVSGQWRGIRFHASSTGNTISCADIHSATDAIVCDSSLYDGQATRLKLEYTTIHNASGTALAAYNSNIWLGNCQLTNAGGDCLRVFGGRAAVVYCTIGQFYPYSSGRGRALSFSNQIGDAPCPLHMIECYNTLITGYADDEISGESCDSVTPYGFHFENCIIRTPEDTALAATDMTNIVYETPEDSVQGKAHFQTIDETNYVYDFRLDSLSTAVGRARPLIYADDRRHRPRKETPDIGCYEFYSRQVDK